MTKQTLSFQAEVKQILHLVTHSLYSNKEIFLRELISNASDACDKLRFEALNRPELYEDAPNLDVRISFDAEAKTLTIRDNGIGLSADEAVANLGTIAKSGTREFMAQLDGDQKKDAQLIGQFGVGFYSGFIVADRITVESRRAGTATGEGVRWSSEGTGDFEIETIERVELLMQLRYGEDAVPSGWKLKAITLQYPDPVSLPILMRKEEWDAEAAKQVTLDEWVPVNKAAALWTRSKSDITEEQYNEFYKQISYDTEAPLAYTHNRVEGRSEYTQLLYVPAKAPFDLWNRDKRGGVKLYVKRVFIMDDAEALMPVYLRFVKGVIDSADLPLNVSRELLQESRDVRAIREGSTKRVISMLEALANSEDEAERVKYKAFWRDFGPLLKEGVGEDHANVERLSKLLRFASTHADEDVSFADYLGRMKEGQEAIYYVTADSLAAAKGSPQLEIYRKKGVEVLLLTDRVDEWMLSHLHEVEGKSLQSVAKGAVDLGALQDEEEKRQAEQAADAFKPVLERLKASLKDRAKDVRVTTRLVDSPACLVVGEEDMSGHLARLLKQSGQTGLPSSLPTLEVNVQHTLVSSLEQSPHFDDLAQILFDQAVLAEGGQLEDPAAYVKRVNRLLTPA